MSTRTVPLIVLLAFAVPVTAADGLFLPSERVLESAGGQAEGVLRSRQVRLDPNRLGGALAGFESSGPSRLELNFFEGLGGPALVEADGGHLPFDAAGTGTTVSGSLIGDPASVVVLSRSGDQISGFVQSAAGTVRVVPLGNGEHRLDEVDTTRFDASVNDVLPRSGLNLESARPLTPRPGEPVDVMILYARDAVARVQRELKTQNIDARVLATQQVVQMNRSYVLSGIVEEGRNAFRLVHAGAIDFPHKDAIFILESLTTGSIRGDSSIPQLREKFGADLVVVVVEDPTAGSSDGLCGLAAGIPELGENLSANGYTVVDVVCSLVNVSLAHEVGHLVGAQHDPDAHGGISGTNVGYVDYGRRVRTTMAYDTGCKQRKFNCKRLPVFSNPAAALKLNDAPWRPGVSGQDNASRMQAQLGYIAAYRERADAKPATTPPQAAPPPARPAPAPAQPAPQPEPPAPTPPVPTPPVPTPPAPAPQPEPPREPEPPVDESGWEPVTG